MVTTQEKTLYNLEMEAVWQPVFAVAVWFLLEREGDTKRAIKTVFVERTTIGPTNNSRPFLSCSAMIYAFYSVRCSL